MSRPVTRTEQIDIKILDQLNDFLADERMSRTAFHALFMPRDLACSYPAFYSALRGDPATPELLQIIADALDEAERRRIRRNRRTCPHCNLPLD